MRESFLNKKAQCNGITANQKFGKGQRLFFARNTLHTLALLLLILFLLSGCLESFTDSFMSGVQRQDERKVSERIVEKPVLSYESEKIVYYFCGLDDFDYCVTGWNKFASFSEEFLHCQVKSLDEQIVADTLVSLHHQNIGLKILFDRDATFTENNYPRTTSSYGFLLSKLVSVQNSKVFDNFCVSDKGVLVGSFVPSRIRTPDNSSFYVIYNTELAGALNEQFARGYSNE